MSRGNIKKTHDKLSFVIHSISVLKEQFCQLFQFYLKFKARLFRSSGLLALSHDCTAANRRGKQFPVCRTQYRSTRLVGVVSLAGYLVSAARQPHVEIGIQKNRGLTSSARRMFGERGAEPHVEITVQKNRRLTFPDRRGALGVRNRQFSVPERGRYSTITPASIRFRIRRPKRL